MTRAFALSRFVSHFVCPRRAEGVRVRFLVAVTGRENDMETNREAASRIVDEAIRHSQLRDCVSHVEDEEATPDVHHFLLLDCEDFAEASGVAEYWGTDRDGEWRVHVRSFGGGT